MHTDNSEVESHKFPAQIGRKPMDKPCQVYGNFHVGTTILLRDAGLISQSNAISYRECPPSKRTSVKVPSLRRLGKDKRKG